MVLIKGADGFNKRKYVPKINKRGRITFDEADFLELSPNKSKNTRI